MATHRLEVDRTKPWDQRLDEAELAQVPGLRPEPDGSVITLEAEVVHETGMRHRGTADRFVFYSDEPESIGGSELDPYPLDYLVASVGFCLVSQVVRCATLLKVPLEDIRCRTRAHWTRGGSILRGDNWVACHALETSLEVTSDAPREEVEKVVRRAEANCFARAAFEQPTVVTTTVSLNGDQFVLAPAAAPA